MLPPPLPLGNLPREREPHPLLPQKRTGSEPGPHSRSTRAPPPPVLNGVAICLVCKQRSLEESNDRSCHQPHPCGECVPPCRRCEIAQGSMHPGCRCEIAPEPQGSSSTESPSPQCPDGKAQLCRRCEIAQSCKPLERRCAIASRPCGTPCLHPSTGARLQPCCRCEIAQGCSL